MGERGLGCRRRPRETVWLLQAGCWSGGAPRRLDGSGGLPNPACPARSRAAGGRSPSPGGALVLIIQGSIMNDVTTFVVTRLLPSLFNRREQTSSLSNLRPTSICCSPAYDFSFENHRPGVAGEPGRQRCRRRVLACRWSSC